MKTQREQVTVTIDRDTHKLLTYACKKIGYKKYGLLKESLREWMTKRGWDPESITGSKS